MMNDTKAGFVRKIFFSFRNSVYEYVARRWWVRFFTGISAPCVVFIL